VHLENNITLFKKAWMDDVCKVTLSVVGKYVMGLYTIFHVEKNLWKRKENRDDTTPQKPKQNK
jgi:hypothetical protein